MCPTSFKTLKVLKILLITCLTLVLLQYIINLLVYNYTSYFFGLDFLGKHNLTFAYLPSLVGRNQKEDSKSPLVIANSTYQVHLPQNSTQSPSSSSLSINFTFSMVTPAPHDNGSLPLCPLVPSKLVGPLATFTEASSFDDILKENPNLSKGGRFKPKDCLARHRVAIVIPYRNREKHLKIFLRNIHPILQRQLIDYGIYVVDMALPTNFNRAMLMNIGYAESLKIYDYQCFIFHDVDLIPENDRNLYTCPENPRHMSVAIDKFKYRLPYSSIFGGVSALTKEQMIKTNGYSNKYFGWGGEDDDMSTRIKNKGYKIIRYSMNIARYKMIKHDREKSNPVNPKRYKLMNTGKARQDKDGINSLKYKVEKIEFFPTYTYILTKINQTEVENS